MTVWASCDRGSGGTDNGTPLSVSSRARRGNLAACPGAPGPDGTIRKVRRTFNDIGHAHELTFSCYRGLPLLSEDRTRRWVIEASGGTDNGTPLSVSSRACRGNLAACPGAPGSDGTIRKLRRTSNDIGHAHESTFSCYRRLPLLSKDRTRQWVPFLAAWQRVGSQHHPFCGGVGVGGLHPQESRTAWHGWLRNGLGVVERAMVCGDGGGRPGNGRSATGFVAPARAPRHW